MAPAVIPVPESEFAPPVPQLAVLPWVLELVAAELPILAPVPRAGYIRSTTKHKGMNIKKLAWNETIVPHKRHEQNPSSV